MAVKRDFEYRTSKRPVESMTQMGRGKFVSLTKLALSPFAVELSPLFYSCEIREVATLLDCGFGRRNVPFAFAIRRRLLNLDGRFQTRPGANAASNGIVGIAASASTMR